ncbi:MAG: hypothetical protein CFE37_03525 [Alphaproteobacteria bacterium PA4]|nr:MAG: hypothetical protein CFE37_03525 [Alphaproteobacteria bacterium PA4]
MPAQAVLTVYTDQADFIATGATLAEDFEGVSAGQRDTGLLSLDLGNFRFLPDSADLVVASAGYMNFAAGVSPTASHVLTSNGDENFSGILQFAAPQGSLGMTLLLNDIGTAGIRFYGATGLMATVLFDVSTPNISFVGIRSDAAITSFVFVSQGGGIVNTGIDNLYTAALSAAPEPASWTLLMTGFAAIGIATRRRRRGLHA